MAGALRESLRCDDFVRVVGAHDGLTALLIEHGGFEAVWAGGFGISAAAGLPDAGLLTMTELHAEATKIRRATRLPVIADVEAGFGDANVVQRMTRLYEETGIDAVCMEDKKYPKRNSFRDGNVLEDPEVFAGKLASSISARKDDAFLVIARLESLITGDGMDDALTRAELYCAAGADALVIHSRARNASEVTEFCARFRDVADNVPVLAIPTTYYEADLGQLQAAGLAGAIYSNQVIRAIVPAVNALLTTLRASGSTSEMEGWMASVGDLFELVGTHRLAGDKPWPGLHQPTQPTEARELFPVRCGRPAKDL